MRIAIDPGHSGPIEPGACAHGLKECDIVLSVARLLKDKLTGHEVMLTRDGDVDNDELSWRAYESNQWGADIFISLHCNAFGDPAAHGAECCNWMTPCETLPMRWIKGPNGADKRDARQRGSA